jgi:ribosomal protein S18 acetylase RimI-like enzyme
MTEIRKITSVMTTMPLTPASNARLAAAVEENLFALFRATAALPGSEIIESEHLSYHLTFPDAPMFKCIWGARLSTDEVDTAIEQTIAWFQSKGALFAAWWFNHNPQPANLIERLKAHGFELDYDHPGMAANLESLDESLLSLDLFAIVPALDDSTLQEWVTVVCASQDMPVIAARAWTQATQALGTDNAPWRLYVGYWSGRPVASSLLFKGAGVAGLYGIGTIPEVRRKGFGKAITLKPLLDARAEGYRYGVLISSDEGLSMYQRLGFHLVDILIRRYMWHNTSK